MTIPPLEQQYTLMLYDPQTGDRYPFPAYAKMYREHHGQVAFLFNPWIGVRRLAGDVGSDPFGHLILPPNEPLFAFKSEGGA